MANLEDYALGVIADNIADINQDTTDISNNTGTTASNTTELLAIEKGKEQSAFGEVMAVEPRPQAQIHAVYGIRSNVRVLEQLSATVTDSDGEFITRTGATAFAVAAAATARPLVYRSGQGALARVTARFDAGQANTVLGAGLFSNTEGVYFGYNGTEFSIFHTRAARVSIQTLTLTVAAGGAETATVTIDGTAYNVPLTAGTIAHNAHELEQSLRAQVTNWEFSQNGNTVVMNQTVPLVTTGAFSYSSTGSSAGSIVENQAGADTTNDIVPQASWNIDTKPTLDPTKYNVYQMRYQYLGAGVIEYGIENPDTGAFDLVHRIKWPNANTTPSLGNPSMFCGWLARSLGGTNDLAVRGISAMTAIEGVDDAPTNFNTSAVASQSVGTTEQSHMIIRSRATFANRLNLGIVEPIALSVANDSSKAAIIRIYADADITADTNFSYIDVNESIVELDTTQATIVGTPTPIITEVIAGNSGAEIDLTRLQRELLARGNLMVTSELQAGAASDVTASLIWEEIT